MKSRLFFAWLLVALFAFAPAAPALAQRANPQVVDLNRRAMESYANLEVDDAKRLLDDALRTAESSRVTGSLLARTYANLGVVMIGGFGDNAAGMRYFGLALEADASIELDPLTSTPDIQGIFNVARNRARNSARNNPPPQRDPDPAPAQREPDPPPSRNRPTRQEPPIVEEDECPPSLPNCHDTQAPQREERTAPPPQRQPQRRAAGLGDTCSRSADCEAGLSCQDNFCVADEAPPRDNENESSGDSDVSEDEANAPRFFFQLGFGGGAAWVKSGMAADTVDDCALPDGNGDGLSDGYYQECGSPPPPSAWEDCQDTNADGEIDTCNVRIQQPGFVPTIAVRAAAGYYILPRLALAAWARFAPLVMDGKGTLAAWQIGARVQYQFTRPTQNGFNIAAFVGTAFGQIQVKPPQSPDTRGEPYIVSGLNSVEVGGIFGYRLMRNFGFYIQPEVHFMVPTFLVAMEFSAGIDVGF